jgi:hypothetical protein
VVAIAVYSPAIGALRSDADGLCVDLSDDDDAVVLMVVRAGGIDLNANCNYRYRLVIVRTSLSVSIA